MSCTIPIQGHLECHALFLAWKIFAVTPKVPIPRKPDSHATFNMFSMVPVPEDMDISLL